jgi:hypothetical protein
MLIHELTEMAYRGGDVRQLADKWALKLEAAIKKSGKLPKKVGTIDQLVVRQDVMTYTVWDGDELVLAVKVEHLLKDLCTIDSLWVRESRRGQRLFTMFLLFLKNDVGCTKMILGDVHSDDTYALLKAGGLKLFKKSWTSLAQDKVEPFSTETIDQFYGAGKWKLVLENTDDLTKFVRSDSFTRSYFVLAHLVNTNEEVEL